LIAPLQSQIKQSHRTKTYDTQSEAASASNQCSLLKQIKAPKFKSDLKSSSKFSTAPWTIAQPISI